MIMTLLSIAGTIFLIYGKLKQSFDSKAAFIWWAIEIFCASLILILLYRYAFLTITDKRSQGFLTYMMTIWFLPALLCGAVCIFAKPKRVTTVNRS